MRKRFLRASLAILLLVGISGAAGAEQICPLKSKIKPKGLKSLAVLDSLAVLQDGRVKPFHTYAQNILLQFSGKRRFEKESASGFLTRLLFAPETTLDDKIFLINNPEIADALAITPEPH